MLEFAFKMNSDKLDSNIYNFLTFLTIFPSVL